METRSITELLHRWYGQPALVIGGGPSARRDLPELEDQGFKPAVVLSANEHGLYQGHYKVDFLVNVDKIHCARKVFMEEYMRQFATPVINTFPWADYQLVDFKLAANSGITAIAVACALGCWPVVVTGVDLFGIGRDYFHDPDHIRKMPRPKTEAPNHLAKNRVNELRRAIGDYPVRPVSGPLTSVFKFYDPAEAIPEPKPCPYRQQWLTAAKRPG